VDAVRGLSAGVLEDETLQEMAIARAPVRGVSAATGRNAAAGTSLLITPLER
jgi:hypothetical protein